MQAIRYLGSGHGKLELDNVIRKSDVPKWQLWDPDLSKSELSCYPLLTDGTVCSGTKVRRITMRLRRLNKGSHQQSWG